MPDNNLPKSPFVYNNNTVGNIANSTTPTEVELNRAVLDNSIPINYNFSQDSAILPNPNYNTSDYRFIDTFSAVNKSIMNNMYNNFMQAIDDIQIAELQGKLVYNPFGSAPDMIIAESNKQLRELEDRKIKGEIDDENYEILKQDLLSNLEHAKIKRANILAEIAEQEREKAQYTTSVAYDWNKQRVMNSLGDSSLIDEIKYEYPTLIGGSMSLMIPQIISTFAANAARTFVTGALSSGGVGTVPSAVIGVVAGVSTAIAPILWGRHKESLAEIGGSAMEMRGQLIEDYKTKYRKDNNLPSDVDVEVPESVMDDIILQTSNGLSEMYKDNMALSFIDAAQALLTPLNTFGKAIGFAKASKKLQSINKTFSNVNKSLQAAKDYNRLTRASYALGRMYINTRLEGFEEGAQKVYADRYKDKVLGLEEYPDKGFMLNLLQDNWDVATSINLIPFGDATFGGKYADDKEFKHSVHGGAVLAGIMGFIPTGLAIRSQLKAYRAANKNIVENGIFDADSRFNRVKASVYNAYFANNNIGYVKEALRNQIGVKDESGETILTREQYNEIKAELDTAYEQFQPIQEKINSLGKDKLFGLYESGKLQLEKQAIKEDAIHRIININEKKNVLETLNVLISEIESSVLSPDIDINTFRKKSAQLQALNSILTEYENLKAKKSVPVEVIDLTEEDIKNFKSRKENLEKELSSLKEEILKKTDIETNQPLYSNADITLLEQTGDLMTLERYNIGYRAQYEKNVNAFSKLLQINSLKDISDYINEERAKGRSFSPGSHLSKVLDHLEKTKTTTATTTQTSEEGVEAEEIQIENEDGTLSVLRATESEEQRAAEALKDIEKLEIYDNLLEEEENAILSYEDSLNSQEISELAKRNLFFDKDGNLNSDGIEYERLTGKSLMSKDPKKPEDPSAPSSSQSEEGASINPLDAFGTAEVSDVRTDVEDTSDSGTDNEEFVENEVIDTERKSIDEDNNLKDSHTVIVVEDTNDNTKPTPQHIQGETSSEINKNTDTENKNNIKELSVKTKGNKIVDALSLATKQVQYVEDETGKVVGSKLDVNGKLIFINTKDGQHLTNTNLIKEGTILTIRVVGIPNNFNFNDTSAANFDRIKIAVYYTHNGNDILVGYIHEPSYIANDNRFAGEIEELQKIKNIRESIITAYANNKNPKITTTVSQKNIGYLNRSTNFTTINESIGEDKRPIITYTNTLGVPVNTNPNVTVDTSIAFRPGVPVLLLPNEIGGSTVYVPTYISVGRLREDEKILNKVTSLLLELSGRVDKKRGFVILKELNKYVYTKNTSDVNQSTIGIKFEEENTPTFYIYGKDGIINKITAQEALNSPNELFTLVGNLRANLGTTEQLKDPSYLAEVKNSPLFKTNIQQNTVLLQATTIGEQKFQYFNNHTVVLDNPSIGVSASQKVAEQTNPKEKAKTQTTPQSEIDNTVVSQPTATSASQQKADIERRRQEEKKNAKKELAEDTDTSKYEKIDLSGYFNKGYDMSEAEKNKRLADDIEVFVENNDSNTEEDYKNYMKTQGHTLFAWAYRNNIEGLKQGVELYKKLKKVAEEINANSDAKYVDAVKKGKMTKEQAMQALEEVGRKDSSAYAELDALEGTTINNKKTIKDIGKENINVHITTGSGAGHITVNPLSKVIDLRDKVGRNIFNDARYVELPNGNIGFVSTFNHLDHRGGAHIVIEISNNKVENINGKEIQSLMDKIKEDVTAQIDKSLHGEEKVDKVRSVINKTISDFINNSLQTTETQASQQTPSDIETKKDEIERLEKEKQETLQPLIEEKEQIEKKIEEKEKEDTFENRPQKDLEIKSIQETAKMGETLLAMDSNEKGFKQLKKSIERLFDAFVEAGYKIILPYESLENYEVSGDISKLQEGNTTIVSPVIYYKGKLVQKGKIVIKDEVASKKEKERTETELNTGEVKIQKQLKESIKDIELDKENSIEDIEKILNKLGVSKQAKFIFNLIKNVAKQLGVTVSFSNGHNIDKSNNGTYSLKGHEIIINLYGIIASPTTKSSENISRVVVHEIVHGVTRYLTYIYGVTKGGTKTSELHNIDKSVLTQVQKDSIENLLNLLVLLKNDSNFEGQYGVTNIDELLAELSNEDFVSKLKNKKFGNTNKSFFDKILDAISKLFGISVRDNNYYEKVLLSLQGLLLEPSVQTLKQVTGNIKSKSEFKSLSLEEAFAERTTQSNFYNDIVNQLNELKYTALEFGIDLNNISSSKNESTQLQQLKQRLEEVNKKIDEVTKRFDSQIAQKQAELKALEGTTTSSGKVVQTPSDIEVQKADIERRRQEEYNTQYNALVAGQVLDNSGDPVYEEDKGIGANGLSTLTDKKYGHGHIRTSGLDSLKVLETLLDGSDFSGMFGQIGVGEYSTWESGKFIIVSNNINPTTNNKLNLNEIEVILNAGLSPFAQELANKYPNVTFKDFNGKKYDAELKALEEQSTKKTVETTDITEPITNINIQETISEINQDSEFDLTELNNILEAGEEKLNPTTSTNVTLDMFGTSEISEETQSSTTNTKSEEAKNKINNILGLDDLKLDLPPLGYNLNNDSIESNVLVAPNEIGVVEQEMMINSILYLLLTNVPDGKRGNVQMVIDKITERIKVIVDNLDDVEEGGVKEKYKEILSSTRLMAKHFPALLEKVNRKTKELGYVKTSEDEFYENIEEHDESSQKQINEEGNSTTNYKDELPPNVKRILYFIPKVRALNPSSPKEAALIATGERYTTDVNKLGFPEFNELTDSWNKLLFYVSKYYFEPTEQGFSDFLKMISSKDAPAIVQEIAKQLKKQSAEDQKLFFVKTNLQYRENRRLLHSTKNHQMTLETGENLKLGQTTVAKIIDPSRTTGAKKVFEILHQEFLANNSKLLNINEFGDLRVDKKRVKELQQYLFDLVNNENNRLLTPDGRKTNNLNEDAFKAFHQIVLSMGINVSPLALLNFLNKYTITQNNVNISGQLNIIRVVFGNLFTNTLLSENANSLSEEDIFEKESTHLKALARYEYEYREDISTGALRVGDKSYFPYIKHHYLSTIYSMINSELTGLASSNSFIKGKLDWDSFAKHSKYLAMLNSKDKSFVKNFKLFYELGASNQVTDNENKLLKDMSPREHEIFKIKLFQNQGAKSAIYFSDTMSDKPTKPIQQALRTTISYTGTINGGFNLSENTLNNLYRYVLADTERILNTQIQNEQLESWQRIPNYHNSVDGKKKGLGTKFLLFEFLNYEALKINNPVLANLMYNEIGDLLNITDIELAEKVKPLIYAEINKRFEEIARVNKQDGQLNNIFSTSEDGKNDFVLLDLIDHNYFNKVIQPNLETPIVDESYIKHGNTGKLSADEANSIIDYAYIDYVVNTAINHFETLMLTGDPAQAAKKSKKKDLHLVEKYQPLSIVIEDGVKKFDVSEDLLAYWRLLEDIEETNINLMKRNASFLASGESGLFTDKSYNVAVAEDITINSPILKTYLSLFKGLEETIKSTFQKGDLTDAQEVTTTKEFLLNLRAFNKISDSIYKKALWRFDNEQFKIDYPGETINKLSEREEIELKNIIFQPQKPVQRGFKIDENLKISKQFYIKTSAFPLIPELVKGTPFEDLLADMKLHNIDRVAFVSGVKQGAVGAKNLLNADGTYNNHFLGENINGEFNVTNKQELDRAWFRIQLEVPYEQNKQAIREGTQLSKMAFIDMPENIEVVYKGKRTTIAKVKEDYIKSHDELVKLKTKKLLKEFGAEEIFDNGNPTGTYKLNNINKLSELIKEEGIDRNWAMNILKGLDIDEHGQFKIPLTFNPNVGIIEPIVTALITNRIAKIKLPGKSYVQGSEFIIKRKNIQSDEDVLQDVQRDIIFTKPEYVNLSKLSFLNPEQKTKDYNKGKAQIILPFYFIKNRQHLDNFIVEENGIQYLDTSKIDKELLEIMGFRIPYQGHNSGMWFEIVGFLPEKYGDLTIVPGEIAAQMGSDYDVDKLYTYHYNFYIDSKGNLKKVNENTTIEDYNRTIKDRLDALKAEQKRLIDEKSANTYLEAKQIAMGNLGLEAEDIIPLDEISLEILKSENNIIEGLQSIFDSNSEVIMKALLNPLGFTDVIEANRNVNTVQYSNYLGTYNPLYQRRSYFSNLGGKFGVSVSANALVGHAIAQETNLFLKSSDFLITDENGNLFSDKIDNFSEEKNTIKTISQETYEYVKDDEVVNANDKLKGAWRLDKIYSFTKNPKTGLPYKISDLISQILGISVDNAKEQILPEFNLNRINFNVGLTMIKLGFDLTVTKSFLNQPILVEYYKRLENMEDIFNVDYTANKKQAILYDLFNEYKTNIPSLESVTAEEFFNSDLEPLNSKDLKDIVNQKNQDRTILQLEVLKHFNKYKDVADEIQSVFSSINIDSKGLPKNIFDTYKKSLKISKLSNGNIGNTSNIKNTIPGVLKFLPNFTIDLLASEDNPFFGYASPLYVSVRNTIGEFIGKDLSESSSLTTDIINNSIKDYIYTGFNLSVNPIMERFNLTDTRAKGHVTVVQELLTLKSKYPNNPFLEIFSTSIDTNQTVELLEIPTSDIDKSYTNRVTEFWYSALLDEREDLRSFAERMVKYAMFVTPQEYGTSSIMKYVPFDYLKSIGFYDYLNQVHEDIFKDEESRILNSETIARQIIQHNPDLLISIREDDLKSKVVNSNNQILPEIITLKGTNEPNSRTKRLMSVSPEGIETPPKFLTTFISKEFGKVIYELTGTLEGNYTYVRIDNLGFKSMKEYNPSINSTNNTRSIIPSNRAEQSFLIDNSSILTNLNLDKFPHMETPKTSIYQDVGEYPSVSELLDNLFKVNQGLKQRTTNPRDLAWIAHFNNLATLLQTPSALKILDSWTIQTSTENASSVNAVNKTITLNTNEYNVSETGLTSVLEQQRNFLHEMFHALSFEKSLDSVEGKEVVKHWESYKAHLIKDSENVKIRGINKTAFEAELFSLLAKNYKEGKKLNITTLRNYINNYDGLLGNESTFEIDMLLADLGIILKEKNFAKNYDLTSNTERKLAFVEAIRQFSNNLPAMRNKYYAYSDVYEFISEVPTNNNLKKELEKYPSLYEKIKNAIVKFIKSIFKISPEKDNLYTSSLEAIFNFVGLEDSLIEVTTPFTNVPISPIGVNVELDEQLNKVLDSETREVEQDVIKTGEIILNQDQEKALEEILDFISDGERKTHSLIGYAGTGKTTLLGILKDRIENSFNDIIFTSPTHRANAVIKLKNKDAKVYTLHQLLGLDIEQDLETFDSRNAKFTPQREAKVYSGDLVIIDESSMINDELFKAINDYLNNLDVKILYVGDDAQIKPVNQIHKSKALTSTEKQSRLTIVQRANNNSLLNESMQLRNSGDFSYQTNISNNKGVEYFNNRGQFLTKALEMFKSEEFKNNPLLLRVLSGTNKVVVEINNKIREVIFGKNSKQYEVGDILMGYSNWKVDFKTKQPLLNNGGDYKILSSTKSSKKIGEVEVEGFDVRIINLLDDTAESFRAFIIDKNTPEETLSQIGKTYEDLRLYAIQQPKGSPSAAIAWRKLTDFKNSFISPVDIKHKGFTKISKTIDYGYSHTIHKSQGGTYKYSFVLADTIDSFQDTELRKQLKYVALTRAEEGAFILTNRKIKDTDSRIIETEQSLQNNTQPSQISDISLSDEDVINNLPCFK